MNTMPLENVTRDQPARSPVGQLREVVPPAFYCDDEPPEPPETDPHWREWPLFESVRTSRLLVAGIVACVCLSTIAHLTILLFT